MKTIRLYGLLGKKFGKKFELDVKNPAEAIRALSVLIKGFKQHIVDDKDAGYKIFVGTEDIYSVDINMPTSDREVIRIVPIACGAAKSKNSSTKIIVGVILIALAYYFGGPYGGQAMTYGWGIISSIGMSLLLSGVSDMIVDSMVEEPELADNNPSYIFDGPVNTTRQGNPVPVGYGRLRVGSQVISAGLTTE